MILQQGFTPQVGHLFRQGFFQLSWNIRNVFFSHSTKQT